jgi:Protein of unknown function (DUF1838)
MFPHRTLLLTLLVICCLPSALMAQRRNAAKTPSATPPAPVYLDLNNPNHAVLADRKIASGTEDGKDYVFYWEGNVFARRTGEKDVLLFHYQAMSVRTSQGFVDSVKGTGYRHVSREVLLYLDPVTRQPVKTWKNPWTNETVEVVHVSNDPVNGRGISWAFGERGPYKFKGQELDGRYYITNEYPLFYADPMGGDYQEYVGGNYHAMEIFNLIADKKELLDTASTAAFVDVAWMRICPFLPWMKMGDRPGQLVFSGLGKKLRGGFDALPEEFKKELVANYPEYQHAPPTNDTRPNETSWTYFKKLLAKKQ